MTFFNHLGSYKSIMQFQISSREKTCKEIPESSRWEFLEKFSANNFALSDAEEKNSWPLNRGSVADLPLLRRLLAFLQNSAEPSFKNTSVRRNKYLQKSRTVRLKVWDPSRYVNHLYKVIWDRTIITKLTRSTSSTRIGKHGVIEKFLVGGSSTTKCDHDCD